MTRQRQEFDRCQLYSRGIVAYASKAAAERIACSDEMHDSVSPATMTGAIIGLDGSQKQGRKRTKKVTNGAMSTMCFFPRHRQSDHISFLLNLKSRRFTIVGMT